MEYETIQLPKPIVDSIKDIVQKTKLYEDEHEFILQTLIKTIAKFRE